MRPLIYGNLWKLERARFWFSTGLLALNAKSGAEKAIASNSRQMAQVDNETETRLIADDSEECSAPSS